METISTKDLRLTVYSLLLEEVKARTEYDERRWENTVIDGSTYSKLTHECDRLDRFNEWYELYRIAEDIEATEVSAFLNDGVARLAQEYLGKARANLRWMSQRAPEAIRYCLRAIVAEQRSSDASLLYAYLMLKDIVDDQRSNYEVSSVTGEDRFKDEQDDSEYDGPMNLGALVKEVTLPAPRRKQVPVEQYAARTVGHQRTVQVA